MGVVYGGWLAVGSEDWGFWWFTLCVKGVKRCQLQHVLFSLSNVASVLGSTPGVVCVGIRLYAPEILLPPGSPGREEALGAPTDAARLSAIRRIRGGGRAGSGAAGRYLTSVTRDWI